MSYLNRLLVLALIFALPVRAAAAQLPAAMIPPDTAALAARIDSVVQADILGHGFPSVSIVVTRGGRTLLERAWGVTDVTTGQNADAATTYRIASVAKQFTAALVLRLADRGKLSVTDPISRHLAGLPPEWAPITIEQLLNHTSGLAPDFRDVSRAADPMPSDSLFAMATRSGLRSAPGASYTYSNTGYLLLALLAERMYGKPFAEVLRDEIAQPLGLTSLRFCGNATDERAAAGYKRTSTGGVMPPIEQHPSQGLGYDAICTTARDIAKWNAALHGGRVVSAASYAAMTTSRGAAAGKYGFGLVPDKAPWGAPSIVHGGESAGLGAHNGWFPAESLSVTLLYNAIPRPRVDMAKFIGMIAVGGTPSAIAPLPVIEIPVAATQGEGRPKYVGAYELRLGAIFIVTFEDGKLHVTTPNGDPEPLFLQSGTTYAMGSQTSKTLITFMEDGNGRVTSFVAQADGVDRTLSKVK